MNILTLDTSSVTAGCGIVDTQGNRILSEAFVNVPLTHSQTILPMVQSVLQTAGMKMQDMDLLAVCSGPGSFTGVRIGVAAAKGLGFEKDMPCAGVSTLEALAYNYDGIRTPSVICAVMDARCAQVYTACFVSDDGILSRLTPDEAISVEDCKKRLLLLKKSVIFVGDGAELCYNACKDELDCIAAPPALRFVRTYGIARCAERLHKEDALTTASALRPFYLRLPQAERELRKRQSK
ncbi:MAG: tRNA (adenosine(37)-N6)-threonylcarbamoyltransferase complex dimerization subunit type 1 TsaB [Acutalibacteraceae bacterium]